MYINMSSIVFAQKTQFYSSIQIKTEKKMERIPKFSFKSNFADAKFGKELEFFFQNINSNLSRACHNSSSLLLKFPPSLWSKFSRTVPVNRNGSCGIIERRDLRTLIGTCAMSVPSMKMFPSSISCSRNRADRTEVFPAPVRSQIPIFSPPSIDRESCSRAAAISVESSLFL